MTKRVPFLCWISLFIQKERKKHFPVLKYFPISILCPNLNTVHKQTVGSLLADECTWSDEERKLNCCPWDEKYEVTDDVVLKCSKELDYPYPQVLANTYDPCAEECIWTNDGTLTADKKIDPAALQDRMKPHPDDDQRLKLWKEGMSQCIKDGVSWDDPDHKCKSGAYKASHCVDSHIFQNCPIWVNTDECNAAKEKMTRCYDKLLMPPNTLSLMPK